MNRRSFFARMLGAACLAVAEHVMPAAAQKVEVDAVSVFVGDVLVYDRVAKSWLALPLGEIGQVLKIGCDGGIAWNDCFDESS